MNFLTAQAILVLLIAGLLDHLYPSKALFTLAIINAVLCILHAFIIQSKVVPLSKIR